MNELVKTSVLGGQYAWFEKEEARSRGDRWLLLEPRPLIVEGLNVNTKQGVRSEFYG